VEQSQVEEYKKKKREIHHTIHWRNYIECLLLIYY